MPELKIEYGITGGYKGVIEFRKEALPGLCGLAIDVYHLADGDWIQVYDEGAFIPLEALPQLRDLIIEVLIRNREERR